MTADEAAKALDVDGGTQVPRLLAAAVCAALLAASGLGAVAGSHPVGPDPDRRIPTRASAWTDSALGSTRAAGTAGSWLLHSTSWWTTSEGRCPRCLRRRRLGSHERQRRPQRVRLGAVRQGRPRPPRGGAVEHPRLSEPEGGDVRHPVGRGRTGAGVDGRDSDRRVSGRRVGGDDHRARPYGRVNRNLQFLAAVPVRRTGRRRTPRTAGGRGSSRAAPAQAGAPPGGGRPWRRAPGGAPDGRRPGRHPTVPPSHPRRPLSRLPPGGNSPQWRRRVRRGSRDAHPRFGRLGSENLAFGAIPP